MTGELPAQIASNTEMFPFDDVIMLCDNHAMGYDTMDSSAG